jgi:anti-sigma regulatory factor (Ser/Thr protein kinase)
LESSIRLPTDLTSARAARAFVAETLEAWGVGAYVLETAVLLTSELVTNAILRARSPIEVTISSPNERVRIAVKDDSEQLPTRQVGDDELGGGHRLQVVEALADRWGTSRERASKTVWFELG